MINKKSMEQPSNNPYSAEPVMPDLQSDIHSNYKSLLRAQEEREQLANQIVLDAIKEDVQDKSTEINATLADSKDASNVVSAIIQDEILRVTDGLLSVPEYHPRAKAEQVVWLFATTHWKKLDTQEFFDFINDCCDKVGLPDKFKRQYAYMERIYQSVAFRIARSNKRYVPSDEARINCKNGTLVIKADGTKEFMEHNPADKLTYCLPYAYDPNAECPLWHKFLDQMLPETNAQTLLAEYIATGFVKGLKIDKMLVLYGRGANGKSVVLEVITNLVGRQNISNVSLDSLTNDDVKRMMIENMVFNISHESNRDIDASVLKTLVSGEPVEGRVLYVGPRTIYVYGKLITSFNILPKAENTHGFYRRFVIMPFLVTVTEDMMDTELSKKLCEELPGILNWVLATIPDLMSRRAFTRSPMCDEALRKYETNSDSVRLFFSVCCELSNSNAVGKDLYDSYKGFCANESMKYVGKQNFYTRLEGISGVVREERAKVPTFNIKVVDYESCRY